MTKDDISEYESQSTTVHCDTCEGFGKVYQEQQAGCNVGGEFACPDCSDSDLRNIK